MFVPKKRQPWGYAWLRLDVKIPQLSPSRAPGVSVTRVCDKVTSFFGTNIYSLLLSLWLNVTWVPAPPPRATKGRPFLVNESCKVGRTRPRARPSRPARPTRPRRWSIAVICTSPLGRRRPRRILPECGTPPRPPPSCPPHRRPPRIRGRQTKRNGRRTTSGRLEGRICRGTACCGKHTCRRGALRLLCCLCSVK